MPSITLADLMESKTAAKVQAEMEAYAKAKGLPVPSWDENTVPKIFIAAFANIFEDFYALRKAVAAMGFLDWASGDGLTLLAYNLYGLTRTPAEFAEGTIILADSGSGPYTIAENQLWIESESGFRFNNTTGGTLVKDGVLSLSFKAEESGVDANSVGTDNAWNWIGNPLAGVTISNPEVEADSGAWLTTQGREVESDDSLRERCRDRWPSMGLGMTAAAWEYHAAAASASVTRVRVVSNPGGVPGLTGVLIAGTDGELSAEVVAEVDAVLQPKKTLTTTLEVSSAVNRVITVTGTLYVDANYVDEVEKYVYGDEEEDIESVLKGYQRTIDIGGKVYKSQIVCILQDILKDVKAVKYVVLTGLEEVIELEDTEIAFLEFPSETLVVTEAG